MPSVVALNLPRAVMIVVRDVFLKVIYVLVIIRISRFSGSKVFFFFFNFLILVSITMFLLFLTWLEVKKTKLGYP